MSETMPTPTAEATAPAPAPAAWDPFQLMDRLDEEALRKELEGIPSTELVYVVREGGPGGRGALQDRGGRVLHGAGRPGPGDSGGRPRVRPDRRGRGARGTVQGEGGAVRGLAHGPGGAARSGDRREAPAALLRARAARPRREGAGPQVPRQDLPRAAPDRGGPRLPRLDGGALQRARGARLRAPDPGGRGDHRQAGPAAQPALVRGGRDEGGAERPVPAHPGDRAGPDDRAGPAVGPGPGGGARSGSAAGCTGCAGARRGDAGVR